MNYRKTMSRLNVTFNNIDLAYVVIAKRYGLTFNSLMAICLIHEEEGVTQKRICDVLHLPKSTVHSILKDFIEQEYMMLTMGNNKKEKFIAFTEEGKKYFSEILKETKQFENRALATLGENACTVLLEITENLNEIILKEIAEMDGKGDNDSGSKN